MHYKRKRARICQPGGKFDVRRAKERHGDRAYDEYLWLQNWPAYWDIIHHRRPRRRKEQRLAHAVRYDRLDTENLSWPSGNHKPHHYYW